MTTTQLRPTVGLPPAKAMPWWVLLVTGASWLVIAWVVLRLDLTTVGSIALLAGGVIMLAGLLELFNAFTAPDWRWLHLLLGGVFPVTGIIALTHAITDIVAAFRLRKLQKT